MVRSLLACAAMAFVAAGFNATAQLSAQSSAGAQGGSGADRHGYIMPSVTVEHSGTTNRIQAVSPVNQWVVWASGVGGTYVKTTDGGRTWKAAVVPGAEALEFRDVQGVSERVAYLLSSGTGTASKIYKTEDGGETWRVQFQNEDPNAFYDCFAFWSPERGITTSDSVNGRFPAIRTLNGGESWVDIGDHLPKAQAGEASFAASGTCVATEGWGRAWIGTGGAKKARVLATTDEGNTWAAYDTPTVGGTASSGVFSIDFRDPWHGILGAGDLAAPTALQKNVARSWDGGKSWHLAKGTPFPGAIYGLSYTRHCYDGDEGAGASGDRDDPCNKDDDWREREGRRTVVATGPGGAAWTPDEGETWFKFPGVVNYWAVAFASPEAGWMVGTEGRILKISF